MSHKLALASAASILMMAAYALLGQAARLPLAGETGTGLVLEAPALHLPTIGLPGLR